MKASSGSGLWPTVMSFLVIGSSQSCTWPGSGHHTPKELLRPEHLGTINDLGRRAFLDDLAVGQDDDAIGGSACEADLVGHHQQGQAVALKVLKHFQDLVFQ